MLYQAPKPKATRPPRALTVKTWPWCLATSMVVWSMRTLKGMRGILVGSWVRRGKIGV